MLMKISTGFRHIGAFVPATKVRFMGAKVFSTQNEYLFVPFDEKDEAKSLGINACILSWLFLILFL
jgi:hypothetical protein